MKRILAVVLSLMMLTSFAFGEAADTRGADIAELLLEGKAEEIYAMMTEEMKAAVTKDSMAALPAQLAASLGELEGVASDDWAAQGEYAVHTVRIHYSLMDALMTLVLDGEGMIAGMSIAPAQKLAEADDIPLPENVTEEEITVDAGEGYPLPGILTLPKDVTNVPAVVLVQGSGASDKDETVGATKMFRDIAYALANQGIAVIRYDKRTYAYGAQIASDPDFASFTIEEETIKDAIAAGRLLAGDERIDKAQIYVLGHSMGAMLAPRIASEADGLFCGMVMLSGTPYPLTKIIYDQNMAGLSALTGDTYEQSKALIDAEMQKLEALKDMSPEEQKQQTAFGISGYYWMSMNEEPVRYLNELNLPALIINGSEDFQVTNENGYDAWQKELEGTTAPVTMVLAQGLNHPLMVYTGDEAFRYSTQEYNVPATVDPSVTEEIVNFIN